MTSPTHTDTRLTRNAVLSVLQVCVTGGVLFLLYRLLLQKTGAEAIGAWSIVLACVSLSKVTELGLSGSAVKFTAKYLALDNSEAAADTIQTTAVTISVALGIILIIGYPAIRWLVGELVPPNASDLARSVLPYALWAAWLSTIGG